MQEGPANGILVITATGGTEVAATAGAGVAGAHSQTPMNAGRKAYSETGIRPLFPAN